MERKFEDLNDTQLKALIAEIQAELAAREKQRKKEAAAQIKALADQAGLTVSVADKAPKRRGRPPKNPGQ